jgi:hypothetical protein
MNRAGLTAAVILLGWIIHLLSCRIAVAPGVTVSVAVPVLLAELAVIAALAWYLYRLIRRDGWGSSCEWRSAASEGVRAR